MYSLGASDLSHAVVIDAGERQLVGQHGLSDLSVPMAVDALASKQSWLKVGQTCSLLPSDNNYSTSLQHGGPIVQACCATPAHGA